MRTITFDTETTGLRPGNICQLAYVSADQASVTGTNIYFKVEYIEPGAQNVHGMSVELLARLSGGKGFGDHADRIFEDFSGASLWIAHNYKFDSSFLFTEFKRCKKTIEAPGSFCTMRNYAPILKLPSAWTGNGARQYKYPNLTELIGFFEISEAEIRKFTNEIFGAPKAELSHHDARYDCAATYLCYKKGIALGYSEGP